MGRLDEWSSPAGRQRPVGTEPGLESTSELVPNSGEEAKATPLALRALDRNEGGGREGRPPLHVHLPDWGVVRARYSRGLGTRLAGVRGRARPRRISLDDPFDLVFRPFVLADLSLAELFARSHAGLRRTFSHHFHTSGPEVDRKYPKSLEVPTGHFPIAHSPSRLRFITSKGGLR